jgi:spore germination protein GerM
VAYDFRRTIKPEEKQDKHLIAKLYSQIQENVKLASALNLGTPVVAQIKALVDNNINNNKANEPRTLYYNKQDVQSSIQPQLPTAGPRPESKDPSLY